MIWAYRPSQPHDTSSNIVRGLFAMGDQINEVTAANERGAKEDQPNYTSGQPKSFMRAIHESMGSEVNKELKDGLKWLHGHLGTTGILACGALCLTAVVKSIPKIKSSTSEVILPCRSSQHVNPECKTCSLNSAGLLCFSGLLICVG